MTNELDLDSLCEAFEYACQGGKPPKIEVFLKRCPEASRAELLRELIQIELWWRRRESPPPQAAEYHTRFPDDTATVAAAFRLFQERSTAAAARTGSQATASYRAAVATTVIGGEDAGREAAQPAPQREQRFGRYQLLKELGRGGMGAVYLAHDEQLNRKVALKIPTFRASARDEMLTRFYREARAAAALRDPGICPVYDVGEINGQAFIAMAFIEGRPLRDYTKSGKPQEPQRTTRVIRKLALAMSEAHAAGIVHRDLKPANIMMEKGRRPVIMDFGLAYSTTDMESRLTGTGAILGTPTYMSPEQAMGDTANIGPATDIYSLGVIFYEMLAGRVPFQGNVTAVLTQIATATPKPLSESGLGIDPKLEQIVNRMMAKQASDRYGSMDELAAALTAYLQEGAAEGEELEAAEAPGEGENPQSRSLQPLSGAVSDTDASSDDGSLAGSTLVDTERTKAPQGTIAGGQSKARKPRVSQAESNVDSFEQSDGFDDDWDDEDEDIREDLRSRRSRSSRRGEHVAKSQKKSRRSQSSVLPLVLGGAAMGLVILVGVYFLLRGLMNREPAEQPVAQAQAEEAGLEADTGPDDADTEVAALTSTGTSSTTPVNIADPSALTKPEPKPAPEPEPERPSLVKEFDRETIGQLAPLEMRTAARPDYLPKFRFPLKPGPPLSDWSYVSRPARVNKVLSWSIEPRRSLVYSTKIDVSRDGLIATGFGDGRVRLYDAQMRLIRVHAEQEADVYAVAFSPDGVWLAACSNGVSVEDAARPETQEPPGRVMVWDVRSGQKVYEHATALHVAPLAWSPDSRVLIVGATLLNLETGVVQPFQFVPPSGISSFRANHIAWSPGGERLAVLLNGGSAKALQVYDTQTGKVVREFREVSDPGSLDWSADGRWFAFVDQKRQVRIHETQHLTLTQTLPQPDVLWLKFSPDSTQLLCSTEPKGTSAYDTRTWQPVATEPELTSGGGGVGVASKWLSNSQQILSHRQLFDWFSWIAWRSCTVNDDGSRVAATSGDLLPIWDGTTGQLLSRPRVDHHFGGMGHYLRWQPAGTLLAALNRLDGTHATALRLLDSTTGKVVQQLEGHTGKVWQVVWSPDGQQLASVGEDSTCRVWDAGTGQQVVALQHTTEQCWLAWSADGKRIACASPFTDVTVWDAKTWEQQRVFRTLKRTFGKPDLYHEYCYFSFLKDSESLFVMDNADGFEVANVRTGGIIHVGKAASYGGLNQLVGLSWSPDFKMMLSASFHPHSVRLSVPGQKTSRLFRDASEPAWLSDSRRIVSGHGTHITGYDTRTGRRLGVLLPGLPDNHWAMIGPDGNYVSSDSAADHLVVTAILDDGRCVTLTLEEFAQQYGWKNDPDKAHFLTLD